MACASAGPAPLPRLQTPIFAMRADRHVSNGGKRRKLRAASSSAGSARSESALRLATPWQSQVPFMRPTAGRANPAGARQYPNSCLSSLHRIASHCRLIRVRLRRPARPLSRAQRARCAALAIRCNCRVSRIHSAVRSLSVGDYSRRVDRSTFHCVAAQVQVALLRTRRRTAAVLRA